jgi:hypothetical protein
VQGGGGAGGVAGCCASEIAEQVMVIAANEIPSFRIIAASGLPQQPIIASSRASYTKAKSGSIRFRGDFRSRMIV